MSKLKNALLIRYALTIAGKIHFTKVKRASKNCKKASENTLRKILEYAKDTEWGKMHHFSEILAAKKSEELYSRWQKNIPPQDYEDLRPFVERHKHGEENILFPGKPKMYATTSGTTNEPKWIPITNKYYDNVYSKMTNIWLYTFLKHRPKCVEGPTMTIVGKAIEGFAPDGTVYGSVSGVTRRDIPEFVKPIYSAPADVFDITDYTARYYTIMRIGIEQDIHVIVTANPSTIVEMQNNVNQFFDDYCNDIEQGTLNEKLNISPEIRKALAPMLHPNPKRAAELRALKEKYGKVLPKHYWPDIQILTTWKCGNTSVYVEKFKDSFPEHMLYQEFSYFSSECRTGLVLNGKNDTVLFPHMHYFEFVSEDEIESSQKKFLRIDEIEVGKRYSIYVTTFAGLYRYNMNDLIEITGKYGTIPTIQFVQKINGIISMTGEKVHERQFIQAVHLAEEETGIKTKFFVGFADVQNSVYDFYYEFEKIDLEETLVKYFNSVVDKKLMEINCEYESKRDSLRIAEPIPFAMQKNSFETYKERCILAGARDGQFKLNLLMQDEKRHSMFKELVRK
jgi:hypothetical protein